MPSIIRLLSLALFAALAFSTTAHGYSLSEFRLNAKANPRTIVAASGGGAWFTDAGGIERIDAHGRIHRTGIAAGAIAAGPRGSVWFVRVDTWSIRRLDPSGHVSTWTKPFEVGHPTRLVAGANGSVWFSDDEGRMGRITQSGHISSLVRPTDPGSVSSMAAGPDGRIWFTVFDKAVYAATAAGTFTRYPTPEVARRVAAGPDGRMWVVTTAGIRRFNTKGVPVPLHLDRPQVLSLSLGFGDPDPLAMVSGPRGRMWMTMGHANEIVDVTPGGHVTEHGPGGPKRAGVPVVGYPTGGGALAVSAGHLWVVEAALNRVGRVTVGGAPAKTPGHTAACDIPSDATLDTRTNDAVVIKRSLTTGDGSSDDFWFGCANTTGRFVELAKLKDFWSEEWDIAFKLAGTQVAILITTATRYDTSTTKLQVRDLAGTTPAATVVYDPISRTAINDVAVTPTGVVAWVETLGPAVFGDPTVQNVRAWKAGTTATLDTGPQNSISGLTLDATTIHWTNAGAPKSAPIP